MNFFSSNKNKTQPLAELTSDKLEIVCTSWKSAIKPSKSTGDETKDKNTGLIEFGMEFMSLLVIASPKLHEKMTREEGWEKKAGSSLDKMVSNVAKVKATNPPSESAKRNLILLLSDMPGFENDFKEAYTKTALDCIQQRLGFLEVTPDMNAAWKCFFSYIIELLNE